SQCGKLRNISRVRRLLASACEFGPQRARGHRHRSPGSEAPSALCSIRRCGVRSPLVSRLLLAGGLLVAQEVHCSLSRRFQCGVEIRYLHLLFRLTDALPAPTNCAGKRVLSPQGGENRGMARQDDAVADHEFHVVEKGSRRANPLDLHVGSRVRLQRMLLGMSQEKLGEQLGLTFQQIQKYEKGINRIGASRLFELARVLGVSVQFFYDDAPGTTSDYKTQAVSPSGFGERQADRFVVDFLSSREGVELNKAFVKIADPKVRRSIVDLVRSLAGED